MIAPWFAPRDPRGWFWLAFWLALVFTVAAADAAVTIPKISTWYAGLDKPWFTPPAWAFTSAWTILHLLIALAPWRLARAGGPADLPRNARRLFFVQLLLDGAWPLVFFGLQAPKSALAIIVALVAMLAATVLVFARRDRLAAALLAPYLAAVVFAAALNGAIVALN